MLVGEGAELNEQGAAMGGFSRKRRSGGLDLVLKEWVVVKIFHRAGSFM
jgi:hypothetical protein